MTDGTLKSIADASRALLLAEKNIRKTTKRLLWLYTQFQNCTAIFTVDTSLYKQTTSHYSPFWAQKGLRTHTAKRVQRWVTILLNNFKMEYLPSKKFDHTDGLSRLILKYKEPLEDTMIVSLQSEGELKTTLCNRVRELPVTLEQIKQEALRDEYIKQIKAEFLKRTSELRMSFLYVTRYHCTGNVAWFRQHSRCVSWKISVLATQGVLEWKVWFIAMSIGKTWTKI